MTLSDASVGKVTVQIGPTLRGTQLRDGYSGASYQDFNDQVLFGDVYKRQPHGRVHPASCAGSADRLSPAAAVCASLRAAARGPAYQR